MKWRDIRELTIVCPTCTGAKRLWLGGKDYVECPDCEATGTVPLIEERIKPPATTIFLAHRTD